MKTKIPTSVRFDEDDVKKIDDIAKKEGVSRSNLIKKATKEFIETSENKNTPVNTNSRISELERKYGNLLNRLNIISKQVDFLIKKVK